VLGLDTGTSFTFTNYNNMVL